MRHFRTEKLNWKGIKESCCLVIDLWVYKKETQREPQIRSIMSGFKKSIIPKSTRTNIWVQPLCTQPNNRFSVVRSSISPDPFLVFNVRGLHFLTMCQWGHSKQWVYHHGSSHPKKNVFIFCLWAPVTFIAMTKSPRRNNIQKKVLFWLSLSENMEGLAEYSRRWFWSSCLDRVGKFYRL